MDVLRFERDYTEAAQSSVDGSPSNLGAAAGVPKELLVPSIFGVHWGRTTTKIGG